MLALEPAVVAPFGVLAASPGTAVPGPPEAPVPGPLGVVPEPPLALPELGAGSVESPGGPSVTAEGLAWGAGWPDASCAVAPLTLAAERGVRESSARLIV